MAGTLFWKLLLAVVVIGVMEKLTSVGSESQEEGLRDVKESEPTSLLETSLTKDDGKRGLLTQLLIPQAADENIINRKRQEVLDAVQESEDSSLLEKSNRELQVEVESRVVRHEPSDFFCFMLGIECDYQ